MSYRIGSFNVYKLSFRADKEVYKDFDTLAKIIKNEKFDIIALQEVLTDRPLVEIMRRLGPKWDYRWEQPKIGPKYSKSVQEAEGYAFVWNTDTMELSYNESISATSNILERRVFEPHIYNQYRIDKSKGEEELARNPYYGRFKPIRSFCEFRLINTHMYFGDNQRENIEKRKHEFDILTRVIYQKISDRRYGNNLPSYTIILGDYNMNLERSWTHGPFVEDVIEIDDNGHKKTIKTVQDQLTTLKAKIGSTEIMDENTSDRGYANNYDHFSYDVERFSGISTRAKKIDSVRKYENDDFEKHRKEISDHVPVVLSMNLRSDEGLFIE